MEKIHNVFFTGGIDSTYRICQLALNENAIVQPIYILFPDDGHFHVRPEMQKEIKAQDEILKHIQAQPQTKAKILPVKRIYRNDIPKNQYILQLEKEIANYKLGWQYIYFALVAEFMQGIELCHETYPNLELEGKLYFKTTDNGENIIDLEKSDSFLSSIFKNVSWPIFGVSRQQMIEDLNKWNYDGVLQYIWWCYQSINGEPCGICDNCCTKIKEGMLNLFSYDGLHRYLVYLFLKSHFTAFHFDYAFREYLYNYDVAIFESKNEELLHDFKLFDKLFKLKISKLKKYIINGTFIYGCSSTKKKKILEYKNDLKRKHILDKFKNFK